MSETDGTATPVEPIQGSTTEGPTEPVTGTAEEVPQETPVSVETDRPHTEPADPEPQGDQRPFYRTTLGLVVIVLAILALLGLCGYAIYNSLQENSVPGRMVPAPAVTDPFVPDGTQNWIEYKTAADLLDHDKTEGNIMYESLALLHPEQGDIRKAVAQMALLEKSGKSYMYVAPKGVKYINTTRKVVEGKLDYRFFEDVTKDSTTKFLTFADGTVAVKVGCANAARFYKDVPGVKVSTKVKKPPTKKPPGDVPEDEKGPDNGMGRQTLRNGHAVRIDTPGYTGGGSGTSGTAEGITQKQVVDAASTTNNGQAGHATAGSGTNDSGESNAGGGAADTSLPEGVGTEATGDVGVSN